MMAKGESATSNLKLPQPCQLVKRFVTRIADSAGTLPILDVACGSGRNAFPFQALGCRVICIDRNLSELDLTRHSSKHDQSLLFPYQMDLISDSWPFDPSSAGAIINVHFYSPLLLRHFTDSLRPGGYLLFETPPGCGGNHIELPREGEVKDRIEKSFEFELYKERRVGPPNSRAVTVKLLARRK